PSLRSACKRTRDPPPALLPFLFAYEKQFLGQTEEAFVVLFLLHEMRNEPDRARDDEERVEELRVGKRTQVFVRECLGFRKNVERERGDRAVHVQNKRPVLSRRDLLYSTREIKMRMRL